MAGYSGKRGRAVELSTHMTAQADNGQKGQVEASESTLDTVLDVNPGLSEPYIVDLYVVGAKLEDEKEKAKPFIHKIRLHGPQGEIVRVWATFDEEALMEAMSTTAFEKAKHRLGRLLPSSLLLRMADGNIVKSLGRRNRSGRHSCSRLIRSLRQPWSLELPAQQKVEECT
jgi:hypothetical protein